MSGKARLGFVGLVPMGKDLLREAVNVITVPAQKEERDEKLDHRV
jgi:hypothetical protein